MTATGVHDRLFVLFPETFQSPRAGGSFSFHGFATMTKRSEGFGCFTNLWVPKWSKAPNRAHESEIPSDSDAWPIALALTCGV